MKNKSGSLTLIGLNIEGQWNLPLLRNAAELSNASLMLIPGEPSINAVTGTSIESLRENFDHILACETIRHSRSPYEYPAPRGRTALIVGNELHGISKEDLRKADQILSVPMQQSQMSSVNVAVAAAISLYILRSDIARRGIRSSGIRQSNVDVLVYGADDPSELGSLFRSVWAFGWRRVFLDDRAGVWFSRDRKTVLAGRAAARKENNPLVVLPANRLAIADYDTVVMCTMEGSGMPLSRFRLPKAERILIVFGRGDPPDVCSSAPVQAVAIDYANRKVQPLFRHAGSILLSYVSECLTTGSRHG